MTGKEINYSSCLSCFRSDPLSIYAQIGVGGFTPGQTINLKFDVDNKSNLNVSTLTVQLVKVRQMSNERLCANILRIISAKQIIIINIFLANFCNG